MATQDDKFGKNMSGLGHIPNKRATEALLKNAVSGDPTGVTGATRIDRVVSLTQAQYDALSTKDATTLYVVTA